MAIDITTVVTPHTILLKGENERRHEERLAAGTIKPGHLIKRSGESVVVHATAGGAGAVHIAKEDGLRGKTINDAYSSGDLVPYHMAQKGDRVYVRVPASATAIVSGNPLTSTGDGSFKLATGGDVIYGDAAEAVDNSAGIVEAFIRMDVR